MATLVRRALAEVCTVPVLLVTSPAGAVTKYSDEYSMSVCGSVGVSVCPPGYRRNHTRDLYLFFMHVAYVRGSVLVRYITIGRIAYRRVGVFFLIENSLSAGKGGWECTARARYTMYDCLA